MLSIITQISLYIVSGGDFYRAVEVFLRIRSFGDFITWFDWLDPTLKVLFGTVIVGVLYIVYLFFAAMLSDKHI